MSGNSEEYEGIIATLRTENNDLIVKVQFAESVIRDQDAEITALRAELGESQRELRQGADKWLQLADENTALKAEIERLESSLRSVKVENEMLRTVINRVSQTRTAGGKLLFNALNALDEIAFGNMNDPSGHARATLEENQ
jgi:chromosome segregation ATPase